MSRYKDWKTEDYKREYKRLLDILERKGLYPVFSYYRVRWYPRRLKNGMFVPVKEKVLWNGKGSNWEPWAKGGSTACALVDKGRMSRCPIHTECCSDDDNFSYLIGRTVALGKLMEREGMVEKEEKKTYQPGDVFMVDGNCLYMLAQTGPNRKCVLVSLEKYSNRWINPIAIDKKGTSYKDIMTFTSGDIDIFTNFVSWSYVDNIENLLKEKV